MMDARALNRSHPSVLTKKEKEYVEDFEYKVANLYFLPKVLKCREIKEAKERKEGPILTLSPPNDLKFRHIIGGPMSVTSHLSQLLDLVLQPLLRHIPGYLKDSFDVIRLIDQRW